MQRPSLHAREDDRLKRLRELGVLDTPPEESFDRIVRLAARLFGTPISLVSLVDADRQWFKARLGLEAAETGRDISFCGHAVANDALLIVEDASRDVRFADNPLVVGPPGIRFYAGAPLRSADGLPLGTLCVIDRAPRAFGGDECEALHDLAALVEGELRRRRVLDTVARNLGRDRQLATLLWLLPDAAFACNSRGEIVSANPAARTQFGLRIRDLIGSRLEAHLEDPTEDPFSRPEHVLRFRRGHGGVFPGKVRWQRLELDGSALTVLTVHDVSEWLERERRLGEQAELLELASDAIVVTDADDVIAFWNRGAEKIYGFTRAQAQGRRMGELLRGEAKEEDRQRFDEVLRGSGFWQGDLEQRGADGRRIAVFSRWTVHGAEGEGARVLKIDTDITARKEVDRIKDEFVSVVNHELRTPLTSVLGALELMDDFGPEELGAEPRELLTMAVRNARRLVRLVNDVLDIEKIASGRMTCRMETVHLRDVISESIECVRGLMARRTVDVRVGGIPEARVEADHDRLVQVVTNLLSNAVKFSPQGATVEVVVSAAGDRVRTEVVDAGPGIPPAFASQIFQRFAQADPGDGGEGSGLGLAICKGLIETMRGSIGYTSQPGAGSTFHIELPMAR